MILQKFMQLKYPFIPSSIKSTWKTHFDQFLLYLQIYLFTLGMFIIFYIKPYMHVYKSKHITSTQLSVNYLEVDVFV